MGSDIHLFVEKRENDNWVPVADSETSSYEGWLYNNRNYNLFAFLADLRNYNNYIPISRPKGLPHDVSKEVKEKADYWGVDGHTHSWLTLEEILEFDWACEDIKKGFVNELEYKEFIKNGYPTSWCGGFGGNITNISNEDMDKIISGELKRDEGVSYYTEVSWLVTYKEQAGDFYTKAIPKLKELGNPENVRIVFWFDC